MNAVLTNLMDAIDAGSPLRTSRVSSGVDHVRAMLERMSTLNPGSLRYVLGDATLPLGEGPRVIAHICNDAGRWGAGFTGALSSRSRTPEVAFRAWAVRPGESFVLGAVQFADYSVPGLVVANMVAQRGVRKNAADRDRRVDYDALSLALERVGNHAFSIGASVHMPRIGVGLGGGDWEVISGIIENMLIANGVDVVVYDLPPPKRG